jgi:3-hydroxybutyryl-CoA dehydratase
MRLPGPGSIYLSQDLQFRRPVKLGETVCATVTVKEIVANRRRVVLETRCEVNGLIVVEGTAVVMPTTAVARSKEAENLQGQAV